MNQSTINVKQFSEKLRSGDVPLCVDVRNPDEYAQQRCRGSVNLPVSDINEEALKAIISEAGVASGDVIYFICAAGKRSQMAADKVRGLDSHKVCVVCDGGVPHVDADLCLMGRG